MKKVLSTILTSILISTSTTSVISCKSQNIVYGNHNNIIIKNFPKNKDINQISFSRNKNNINPNYDGYISTSDYIYKLKYNLNSNFNNLFTPEVFSNKTNNLINKDIVHFKDKLFLFQGNENSITNLLVTSITSSKPNYQKVNITNLKKIIYYQEISHYLLMEAQLNDSSYKMVLCNSYDKIITPYFVSNSDFTLGTYQIPNNSEQNQTIIYQNNIYFIFNHKNPTANQSNIYKISIEASKSIIIKPYDYLSNFKNEDIKSIYYVEGDPGGYGKIIAFPKNISNSPYFFTIKKQEILISVKNILNNVPGQISFQWNIYAIRAIGNNVFLFTKNHGIIQLIINFQTDDRKMGEFVPKYNFIEYNNNNIININFISNINDRVLWFSNYINGSTHIYQILNPNKQFISGNNLLIGLVAQTNYKAETLQVTKSNECLIYYKTQGLYLYN